jgi:hypothetical protein
VLNQLGAPLHASVRDLAHLRARAGSRARRRVRACGGTPPAAEELADGFRCRRASRGPCWRRRGSSVARPPARVLAGQQRRPRARPRVCVLTFLLLKSSQRLLWKARYRRAVCAAETQLTNAYPRLHLLRKSTGR